MIKQLLKNYWIWKRQKKKIGGAKFPLLNKTLLIKELKMLKKVDWTQILMQKKFMGSGYKLFWTDNALFELNETFEHLELS